MTLNYNVSSYPATLDTPSNASTGGFVLTCITAIEGFVGERGSLEGTIVENIESLSARITALGG